MGVVVKKSSKAKKPAAKKPAAKAKKPVAKKPVKKVAAKAKKPVAEAYARSFQAHDVDDILLNHAVGRNGITNVRVVLGLSAVKDFYAGYVYEARRSRGSGRLFAGCRVLLRHLRGLLRSY